VRSAHSKTQQSHSNHKSQITMGAAISRSMAKIFGSKEMRLLMLGLDAAGKTSRSSPLPTP